MTEFTEGSIWYLISLSSPCTYFNGPKEKKKLVENRKSNVKIKPKNSFLWPNIKVCVLKIIIYKMSDLEIFSVFRKCHRASQSFQINTKRMVPEDLSVKFGWANIKQGLF